MLEPDAYTRRMVARERQAVLAREPLSTRSIPATTSRGGNRDVKAHRLPVTAIRFALGLARSWV